MLVGVYFYISIFADSVPMFDAKSDSKICVMKNSPCHFYCSFQTIKSTKGDTSYKCKFKTLTMVGKIIACYILQTVAYNVNRKS